MAIAASDLAKDMFRIIDEKGVATCIVIYPSLKEWACP